MGFKRAKRPGRDAQTAQSPSPTGRSGRQSGHEHACGGGQRQHRADTDEDLADQRALVPGRVLLAARHHRRRPRLRDRLRRRPPSARAACPVAAGAVDIGELVGRDHPALGAGGRRVLSAAACTLSLARGRSSRSRRRGRRVSAAASCALALATGGGIWLDAGDGVSGLATSALRRPCCRLWPVGGFLRRLGAAVAARIVAARLARLGRFRLLGRAVRLSNWRQSLAPPAQRLRTGSEQLRPEQKPVAARPLAFNHVDDLPHCASPGSEQRPWCMTTAGRKQGSSGKTGQNRGKPGPRPQPTGDAGRDRSVL